MTKLSRLIVCAVMVVGVSTARAASVAPNVQVNVKQGRTKIFTGVSDGSGRFTTPPLEPGIYTFELRALKTAPPAQYFLLLSGAKPVTAAMADKKAVLMMDAQVRRPRSVSGQVTARRLRIVTPTPEAPASNVSTAPVRGAAPATATLPPPAAATRSIAPARIAAPAAAATTAPAPRVPMRSAAAPVVRGQSTMMPPAAATPAEPETSGLTTRPPGAQTRVINGRTHVWVPIAPGSTLGRWVPGRQ